MRLGYIRLEKQPDFAWCWPAAAMGAAAMNGETRQIPRWRARSLVWSGAVEAVMGDSSTRNQ